MNPGELERFRNLLVKERQHLTGEIRDLEHNHLAISQSEAGEQQSYDDHFGDLASDTFEREKDLSLEFNVKDILSRVNEALARIEGGNFGVCVHCRQEIEPERLGVLPYAELCIACKAKEERSR